MAKRILLAALAALLLLPAVAAACTLRSALESGPLADRVRQFEDNGWVVARAEWTQVVYVRAPTPPFLDAEIRVVMYRLRNPGHPERAQGRTLEIVAKHIVFERAYCGIKEVRVHGVSPEAPHLWIRGQGGGEL